MINIKYYEVHIYVKFSVSKQAILFRKYYIEYICHFCFHLHSPSSDTSVESHDITFHSKFAEVCDGTVSSRFCYLMAGLLSDLLESSSIEQNIASFYAGGPRFKSWHGPLKFYIWLSSSLVDLWSTNGI